MAIPTFQTLMLPMLRLIKDNKPRTIATIVAALGQEFGLTSDEMATMLPSGKEEIFRNRVRWARFYLLKAGLVVDPERGATQISAAGQAFLAKAPKKLDVGTLQTFAAFGGQKTGKKQPEDDESAQTELEITTPEESIEFGYQKLRKQLQSDLIEKIKSSSPRFFERLVVELTVRLGYGGSLDKAGTVTGKTGDEGIDGVIKEDKLGRDLLYIQAKRWDRTPVTREDVQKFVEALHGKKARKGIFITTSVFSKTAIDYANAIESKVILIDGEKLTELMFETNLGCSVIGKYEVKKLDSDYFAEDDAAGSQADAVTV